MTVRKRWLAAGAAAVALAGGTFIATRDSGETTFCSAEALIGPNGETYGRTGPDCQFEDEDGELVTHLNNGTALCYDDVTQVVSCDQPGSRPPR